MKGKNYELSNTEFYFPFPQYVGFQWKCCDIHVKEFDEFMEIPPCTRGWHNADPDN